MFFCKTKKFCYLACYEQKNPPFIQNNFPFSQNRSVEIQQEDPSENYAPTLGWSLRLFLGGCIFINA